MTTPEGSARRPSWLIALACFTAAAAALCAAWVGATRPRLFSDSDAAVFPANRMTISKGGGQLAGRRLVIGGYDSGGNALVAVETPPLPSAAHGLLWWDLAGGEGASLALLWRSNFYPGRVFSRPVEWTQGLLVARLDEDPNWIGRITGVALAIRGPGATPLQVGPVRLETASVGSLVHALVRQWGEFEGWRLSSTHFLYGGGAQPFARLQGVAAWIALLAAAGYLAVLLALRRAIRPGVLFGILALAWVAVDARALWNGARQSARTVEAFAGKSESEALLAADDGTLYGFLAAARRAIGSPDGRVFVFAGSPYLRGRAAYHLLPLNAWWDIRAERPLPSTTFRPGDVLVVAQLAGVSYAPGEKVLLWVDGSRVAVEPLLVASGTAAFRVR